MELTHQSKTVAVFRHFLQTLMLLYIMSFVVLKLNVFVKKMREVGVLLKCVSSIYH